MKNLRVVPMPGYEEVGGYCVVNASNHSEADCCSLDMARLVAAAPDMLAALMSAECAAQELCNGQDKANECWNTLATIRSAIAKAKVGTP